MELNKTDIGIKITQEGKTELYLPKIDEYSGESIMSCLKEIRKLERTFTELANEVCDEDELNDLQNNDN